MSQTRPLAIAVVFAVAAASASRVFGYEPDDAQKVVPTTVYEDKSISFTGGEYKDEEFHYRLMKPANLDADTKYPLVIFLHGAGERGSDNQKQLTYFPTQMAQPRYRERFPCFVLAPQCRDDHKWMNSDWTVPADPKMQENPSEQTQTVMQMIESTLKNEAIDPDRVYLTGLSMGGFGSFDLGIRHPDWFAAIAPICGAADLAKVGAIKNIPVWIVHGSDHAIMRSCEAKEKDDSEITNDMNHIEAIGRNGITFGGVTYLADLFLPLALGLMGRISACSNTRQCSTRCVSLPYPASSETSAQCRTIVLNCSGR